MPEDAHESKLPHIVFAFFTWQCDVLREITPAEAEAFFDALSKKHRDDQLAALQETLLERYPKLWREYTKHGPVTALELSVLARELDIPLCDWLKTLLEGLHHAAASKKRRQNVGLASALQALLGGDSTALNTLKQYFDESRFKNKLQLDAEKAPVPLGATPAAEETAPAPVQTVISIAEPITAPLETLPPDSVLPTISILKLVPWSEHDAVDPGRLQFWTKGSRAMRCIGIIERSADFKSFQFMAEEPTLFFYKPGQFVTLELFIDGKRVVRSYTISSSPSRPHLVEISVKRVKHGLVSNYLHDQLNIGDTVMMKPPAGKFHCFDTTSDKYLFLSAGSGITPMLSMARWWHDTGAHPDVIFFHSVREPEDAVFAEDMISFTSANRQFRYITSFTSPALPESWPGMKGRFNEDKLHEIAPDFRDRMIFTCGPDSFMKNVRLILDRHEFPVKDRYRQESFGSPAKAAAKEASSVATQPAPASAAPIARPVFSKNGSPTKRDNESPVIHFSLSALEVFGGDMDVPILDLAEELQVEIPSSCRSGTCGTCRALKIRGEVDCDDMPGLSDADREAGYILTCVSRAKTYVEIEV